MRDAHKIFERRRRVSNIHAYVAFMIVAFFPGKDENEPHNTGTNNINKSAL